MNNGSSKKPYLPASLEEAKIHTELEELTKRVERGEIAVKEAQAENDRLMALLARQIELDTRKKRKANTVDPVQLGKLAFLLVLLTILYFFIFYRPVLNEYKIYVFESHPNLDFEFYNLSEAWAEKDLKEKLSSVSLKCIDDPSLGDMGDRSCYADIESHNKIPAMLAVFFFKKGKLNAATIHVPRWAHKKMRDDLVRFYGTPTFKRTPEDSLIDEWTLANRSKLLYNTEPSSTIGWSAICWMSNRAAEKNAMGLFK